MIFFSELSIFFKKMTMEMRFFRQIVYVWCELNATTYSEYCHAQNKKGT